MSATYEVVTTLKDLFGTSIELFEEAEGEDYTLLAELVINGTNYAFFSNDDLKKDDEVFILKYAVDAEGEYELITVDNDDEWEDVSEIFDEYMLQD
jgi:uncharacterized protein YrzB (UPF0473 family)